jgi:hypothetical protein
MGFPCVRMTGLPAPSLVSESESYKLYYAFQIAEVRLIF